MPYDPNDAVDLLIKHKRKVAKNWGSIGRTDTKNIVDQLWMRSAKNNEYETTDIKHIERATSISPTNMMKTKHGSEFFLPSGGQPKKNKKLPSLQDSLAKNKYEISTQLQTIRDSP